MFVADYGTWKLTDFAGYSRLQDPELCLHGEFSDIRTVVVDANIDSRSPRKVLISSSQLIQICTPNLPHEVGLRAFRLRPVGCDLSTNVVFCRCPLYILIANRSYCCLHLLASTSIHISYPHWAFESVVWIIMPLQLEKSVVMLAVHLSE